ncbi:MAG TPA: ATP-binding protein [Candidatus Binatia bacterium]
MSAEEELKLRRQVAELEAQLGEAQNVLQAIYNREVDAVVVRSAGGEQVFTLQAAEHPYRVMVETMSEGAVTLSQDGTVLHCNCAFAQLLGRPLQELIGSCFAAWVKDQDQACYVECLQNSAEPRRSNLQLVRADGEALPVQLACSPLNLDDLPGAICVIVLDLTEQKRRLALEIEQQAGQAREQALRHRQEELERLNRELEDINRGMVSLYAELDEKAKELRRADEIKTRFLSNMSHEFRTPVNSIFALSQLLLDHVDGELTGEQEKQVGFIRKAADSLLDLVNDLLDLAKIRAGKLEVHPVEFDAANLFSALRGMLRSLQVNPGVTLVFEEPEDIPALYTDEGKVSQILRNFISNGLKFTECGEVRVSARHNEGSGTVTFTVSDTGMGIAPQDHWRIFEEFTQLENPAQSHFKGTGLGLPLCRNLAELLGGRIELESEVGVGSKFSVTLPMRYAAESEARSDGKTGASSEEMHDGGAGFDIEPTALRRDHAVPQYSVLIIDDEPMARYVMASFFKGQNCVTYEAQNGGEGIRMAREIKPQLVLLDLHMPDMSGYDVLDSLKVDSEMQWIPVAVVTSAILTDQQRRSLEPQTCAILSKSALSGERMSRLMETVRREAERRNNGLMEQRTGVLE